MYYYMNLYCYLKEQTEVLCRPKINLKFFNPFVYSYLKRYAFVTRLF